MQESILSHIASKFVSQYENVANSSIAYLLNKYSSAREALKNILDFEDVPIYYVTELDSKINGRPDVTGIDANGKKKIIIEGKFWANLTENQPNNYLKEITEDGKILFLAPEKRSNSLLQEIKNRIGEKEIEKVVVYSWLDFIKLIEVENEKDYDKYLKADLLQIKKLCEKMDVEGMPPLSSSDLDPMNGRISSNFADIIDECNSILRNWSYSNFDGLKSTAKKYGYGFYFLAYDFGCYLHFDTQKWYLRENHTPFWLLVTDKDWEESFNIQHYLKEYDRGNSFGSEYGIILKPGMDKTQVIDHIVNKTKEVLNYLNSKLNEPESDN